MVLALLLAIALPSVPTFNPLDLVERYHAYRLSEPPEDAVPVLIRDGSVPEGGLVALRSGSGPTTQTYFGWRKSYLASESRGEVIDDRFTGSLGDRPGFQPELWAMVALLESRGYPALAEKVTLWARKNASDLDYVDQNPWRGLHVTAWSYWKHAAIAERPKRSAIYQWLRGFPKLDGLSLLQDETEFLKDLKASVDAPGRQIGSARYDRLIESTTEGSGLTFSDAKYGITDVAQYRQISEPVRALWSAGFDAVPALFRHLSDRRITQLGGAPGHGAPYYHRVCDIARDLLDELLEGEADFYWCTYWDHRRKDTVDADRVKEFDVDVKRLRNEWVEAQKLGERRYLLKRLDGYDEELRGALNTVGTEGMRAYPLRVLSVRYPRDLARFLTRVRYEEERDQIKEYQQLAAHSLR